MSKWPVTTLHNKIFIKHGFPFKSEYFSESGDYIVLTPGNFFEAGGFKRQAGKEKFYTGKIPKEYLHKKGDLIVAMTEQAEGLLGSCARVPESEVYLHNQRLGLISTDTRLVTKEYIYHLFKTKTVREQLRLTSSGSKVKHTSPERIYNVQVPLPEVETQKRITKLLDTIEEKIELNNRINAELEAMAKTLYDYWFVQFDFPDANGKPYKSSGGKMVYNEALKRNIPVEWSVNNLKEITPVSNESITPKDHPEALFRHFSIPVFDSTQTYGVECGSSIGSNKFKVNGSDLLVSKLNPWFSRVIYALEEDDQICSTEFVVWRTNSDSIKNFLYQIATSGQFISYCTQSATGTSNSHKRVNPTVMMQFKFPFCADIATAYGEKIDSALKEIMSNKKQNKQLVELRDWLLPMLMNGQVKVQ
ncbi:restriction endonuclease subunit S [Endozoicomonas sp. Mp262]|uniref:restriction endonuclease subunit S n=1 Tax=Endozoicomonas sp. Mp262 TaxID=2919499 RepID=UPI0021D819A4